MSFRNDLNALIAEVPSADTASDAFENSLSALIGNAPNSDVADHLSAALALCGASDADVLLHLNACLAFLDAPEPEPIPDAAPMGEGPESTPEGE